MPRQKHKSGPAPRSSDSSVLPWKSHRLAGPVTLEEIAESTKISRRFFEAIECADFRELPGGLFRTSYIRQYAAAIGFDADVILAHSRRMLEPDAEMASSAVLAPKMQPRWAKLFFFNLGE